MIKCRSWRTRLTWVEIPARLHASLVQEALGNNSTLQLGKFLHLPGVNNSDAYFSRCCVLRVQGLVLNERSGPELFLIRSRGHVPVRQMLREVLWDMYTLAF